MNKLFSPTIALLCITFVFTSCRPKDLEGAFVAYNNQQYDSAFSLAKKSTQLYPQNAEAWYLLGVLYSKKDSVKEMVNAFNKSTGIDNSKLKEIESEKFSTYASKFNAGASSFNKYSTHSDRSSEEATKIMESSIKDFNDSYLCKKDFNAVLYAAQGYTLLGKKDGALEKYMQLTDEFPDSANAWIGVGRFYFDEKDYEKATHNFVKATKADDSNYEAYALLAHSYDYQNKDDLAISSYEKALSLNPTDAPSYFNLGRLYYKLGTKQSDSEEIKNKNLEKAILSFASSIENDPEFINSHQLKGNAELLIKKYEEAKNTLEEGVDRFPDDKQMWEDLSIAYTWLGDKKKAEAAIKRAEEL